jgi:hypothetical protein
LALALGVCLALWTPPASAQGTVKQDGAHPSYKLELEPHLALGWVRPPGDANGAGIGGGLRLNIPVADRGLIDGVNDSVAIGLGLDVLHHTGGGPVAGDCAEYVGTGAERICIRVAGAGGPSNYILLPVVFQWNFFLSPEWSVFGEPGLGGYIQFRQLDGSTDGGFFPVFQAGGRYHFSEKVTLTLRAGYPDLTIGLSFFL